MALHINLKKSGETGRSTSPSAYNLRSHTKIHLNHSTCEVGGSRLSTKCHMQIHLRKQKKQEKTMCIVCGFSTSHKYGLKRHLRTHTGEKPYSCGSEFSKNSVLRRHLQNIHPSEKLFSCKVCGIDFHEKSDLNKHFQTHGAKPFSCKVCGSSFGRKDILESHMRTHTGEKPYSCVICGSAFSSSYRLKTHIRIHTGEKPFSCDVCGCLFADSTNCKVHMRRHTGEKPYSCPVCDYKCYDSSTLKNHVKTHRGSPLISSKLLK